MKLTILLNTAQFSRRLLKQMLFQQSTLKPHLQVQEAICCAPETCVMCQLWRAARGKGRLYLQCRLQTFLLIYHKWDFQWLACSFPIHQIISKWHYSLKSFPLKPGFWKDLSAPCKGGRHHVNCTMNAGTLAIGNVLLLARHGITFFYFGLITGNWKTSGNLVTDIWLVGSFAFWYISTQPK